MATTLTADMDAVTTTAALNAGHDPVKANDILQIDAEKMKVTSIAGDPILTVTRAQAGTTAAAHTTGANVGITSGGASICEQIAPGGTYPGFMPVPAYVYLGTCADSSSEPTWQEISNVESVTIASPSTAMLDVTNLNNPSRIVQQIPGLTTPGDVTLTVNYWPDDPTHDETTGLIHLSQTKEIRPYRVVCNYDLTDPSKQLVVTFAGSVTGLPLNFQGTAVMKLVATIKQYGAMTVEHGQNVMPVSEGKPATLKFGGSTLGAPTGSPIPTRPVPSMPLANAVQSSPIQA
jgi:hypothetical protein